RDDRSFKLSLLQAVAERNALVEHKAFAAPAAVLLAHLFQIFQNAAPQMIDLGKAAREQQARGLLAADAAGAEHRDTSVLCRIKLFSDEIPELAKACEAGIDRAVESAHGDLESVAGVEQERAR